MSEAAQCSPLPSRRFSALGRRASAPTIARLMSRALENPGLLSLAAGFTDTASLPAESLAQEASDFAALPAGWDGLQYGSNQGRSGLRQLLAQRLSAAEPNLDAEQLARSLMITNGSQQALYLAMQVLCDPGDLVLVDRPSYFVYLEMLAGLGVDMASLPTHAEGGLDAPALTALLTDWRASGRLSRLKAVYFVSYFSNPANRCLSEEDKITLAEVLTAAGVNVPVIEDAAYRELYFDQPYPARSILSLDAWAAFPRLYVSTLTKPYASGLKVGYALCTDTELLDRMLHVKGHHDFGTAHYPQALLERQLAAGGLDRQLAVVRPRYAAKMQTLHEVLAASAMPLQGWRWQVPTGGLYLWLSGPPGLDAGLDSAFCAACLAAGVLYVPGELCFGDAPERHWIRLSYGVLNDEPLREAAHRFASVASRV